MIYILGASHIMAVLAACVHEEDNLYTKFGSQAPKFFPLKIRPNTLDGELQVASLYLGHTHPYWGHPIATQTAPNVIGMAKGFQELLSSVSPEQNPDDTLFVFMSGEEHHNLGLIDHQTPIDFHIPWRTDLPALHSRQVIPFEVIEKQIQAALTNAIANFMAIRSIQRKIRVFNMICPPPIPQHLMPNHDGPKGGDDESHACDWLRLKYYLTYVKLLTAATDRLNIVSVMPHPDTQDGFGFLNSAYVGDRVHGNKLYGLKVIDMMNQLIKG